MFFENFKRFFIVEFVFIQKGVRKDFSVFFGSGVKMQRNVIEFFNGKFSRNDLFREYDINYYVVINIIFYL